MNVLVLNCGSSTLKFQVVTTDVELIERNEDRCLVKGAVERIGSQSLVTIQRGCDKPAKHAIPLRDHGQALDHILQLLLESGPNALSELSSFADIHAVGHRVVHGGERFKKSVLLDAEVLKGIEDCIELAPLHNPANLKGIRAATAVFGPNTPQVAVFDTSFHSTMPELSYLYPIPYSLYRRHRIRRYGFHGTSHRYVAYRYRVLENKQIEEVNVISLHLGNGCSACLIKDGNSYDTSMGFTPLEGLMMGTRSGDIDPSIVDFIAHKEGMSVDEVDLMLNKQSGLLGLSGITNDMRELLDEEKEHKDRRVRLAIDMYCQRVKKYIGAYMAESSGIDALIFTGGVGENSAAIRSRICKDLAWMGVSLDEELNFREPNKEKCISDPNAREAGKIKVFVIPTNEELLIARDTLRCVKSVPRRW